MWHHRKKQYFPMHHCDCFVFVRILLGICLEEVFCTIEYTVRIVKYLVWILIVRAIFWIIFYGLFFLKNSNINWISLVSRHLVKTPTLTITVWCICLPIRLLLETLLDWLILLPVVLMTRGVFVHKVSNIR